MQEGSKEEDGGMMICLFSEELLWFIKWSDWWMIANLGSIVYTVNGVVSSNHSQASPIFNCPHSTLNPHQPQRREG